MKRKTIWLLASCLMVVALVLASCGQAADEEEEVIPPSAEEEEEEEIPSEEEEVVSPEESSMVKLTLKKLDGTPVEKWVERPRYGGTLIIGRSANPNYFDEADNMLATTDTIMITNESLLQGDWARGHAGTGEWSFRYLLVPIPGVLVGALAESYELPDDTTIIYHIRQGVHFHNKPPTNGRELVAEDVVFTLKRDWTVSTSYQRNNAPWETHFQELDGGPWIKALDKYTVEMKVLPGKQGKVWELASNNTRMIPHEVVDMYGDLKKWENSCGTGPYMLTDYIDGSSITFEKNPSYWQHNPLFPEDRFPYPDGMKWLIIPDISTRLSAIRTGKVDHLGGWGSAGASPLPWEDAQSLIKTNPELKYAEYKAVSASAIHMRVDKPELPYYDLRVRRALAMAIDHQAIKDDYYGGHAEIICWPIANIPEFEGVYTPINKLPEDVRELFEYHPDKAKQLLTEAGYPDGFDCEIVCTSGSVDILSIVKDSWSKIGIELTLNVKEIGAFYGILYGPDKNPGMINAGCYGTLPYINVYSQPGNIQNASWIDDPRINEAYEEWEANYFNTELKRKLVGETAIYKLSQAYILQLTGSNLFIFWQPWLKGYDGENGIGYLNYHNFTWYVWLDQDLKEEMTGNR